MKNTNTLLILAAGEGTRSESNPFGLKLLTSYKGKTVLENLVEKTGPSDLLIAVRTVEQSDVLKDWLRTYLRLEATIKVLSTSSPFETLQQVLPLSKTETTTIAVGDGFYSNNFPQSNFISVAELHNSYIPSFHLIEKKETTFLAFTGVLKDNTSYLMKEMLEYRGIMFGHFCKALCLPLLFNTGKWKDVGTAFTTDFAEDFFKKTNNVTTVSDASGVTKFFTCNYDKQAYENSLPTLKENSLGNFVNSSFIPGIVLRQAAPEYALSAYIKIETSKQLIEDIYFKKKSKQRLSQSWKTHLGKKPIYIKPDTFMRVSDVLALIEGLDFSSTSLLSYHGDFTLDNCIVTDKEVVFIDGKRLLLVTDFHELSKMYCSCVYNFPEIAKGNFQLLKDIDYYITDLNKTQTLMSISMKSLLEVDFRKDRLVLGMYLHLICMSATHSNKELGLTFLIEGVKGLAKIQNKS